MLITTWSLRNKLIIHVPALRTSRLETLSCLPLTSSGEQKKNPLAQEIKVKEKSCPFIFLLLFFFFLNKNLHQCIRFISLQIFQMSLIWV